MEWSAAATAGFGLFLAGIVKGATGLGYASCALPFLALALGLQPAMALVILPAMATNVSVAFTAGHVVETLQRFKILYASMLPGIASGICLLLVIDPALALKLLGTTTLLYGVLALARPRLFLSPALEAGLQGPTGFLNGMMTGLTGAQVMPLFPYMMALNLEPNRMVQAINLAVTIASAVLLIGLSAAGVMTVSLLGASTLAIIPALAGAALGTRARALIPAERFRRVMLFTLLLMGLLMIARS